ncbi:YceI family protein [soil metagenome]
MAKEKWILDPTHSELVFKVKHLMISTVTGRFKKFNVIVESRESDFTDPLSIELVADIDSIDTNNEQRDTHLKSEDFFNAYLYSQLVFKSTQYAGDDQQGKLTGDLTVRGITKPVTVNVEQGGIAVDSYGQTKAGFTIDGKMNRKDFGLTWSAVTEAGGVVVGDEVKIYAEIQLIKQVGEPI